MESFPADGKVRVGTDCKGQRRGGGYTRTRNGTGQVHKMNGRLLTGGGGGRGGSREETGFGPGRTGTGSMIRFDPQ